MNLGIKSRIAKFSPTSRWRKLIKWCLIIGISLHILLFTFFGQVFYTLVIMEPIAHRVDRETREKLCDASNRLLETLQPLVSDDRMIRHFEKNREGMQKAVEMSLAKQHVRQGEGLTPEYKALLRSIDIDRGGDVQKWPSDPYSQEKAQQWNACMDAIGELNKRNLYHALSAPKEQLDREAQERYRLVRECNQGAYAVQALNPAFGTDSHAFYCATRKTSFKSYLYFPGAAPRIENGLLLGPARGDTGRPLWTIPVRPDTDHIDRKDCTLRQIDAHWFISLC